MSKRSKLKTKNKKLIAVDVYPKEKLYLKSNPLTGHISFTKHTSSVQSKQQSKKLNVIQRRNAKKERDTTISLNKQNQLANILLSGEQIYEKFVAYFK